jgi:hypothetical protein
MAMTRMRYLSAVIALTLPLLCAAADEHWSLEAYVGDAHNFRTRLEVEQDGGYSRSLRADYETRGFDRPLYYVLRAARWQDVRAWEVSLIHHKLYLRNPPQGVAALSISHGFNIFSISRAGRSGDWIYRLGAGPVVTHAEATINGVRYDGPYRLAGAAVLAGGGRRFELGRSVFLSVELMATAAHARAKLPGSPGAKIATNSAAIHALAGVGIEFR